ncbi:DUF4181 domain-containing protein [Halalkalibacter akibai]|uniref:DUF4181 domain-containing protein n=1 Tax=Halalkalibacter akibai TaxID=1411 RepID=UPI0005515477|nr:DUF4181 domain-containing protein [Halalkalibacter akibai]
MVFLKVIVYIILILLVALKLNNWLRNKFKIDYFVEDKHLIRIKSRFSNILLVVFVLGTLLVLDFHREYVVWVFIIVVLCRFSITAFYEWRLIKHSKQYLMTMIMGIYVASVTYIAMLLGFFNFIQY